MGGIAGRKARNEQVDQARKIARRRRGPEVVAASGGDSHELGRLSCVQGRDQCLLRRKVLIQRALRRAGTSRDRTEGGAIHTTFGNEVGRRRQQRLEACPTPGLLRPADAQVFRRICFSCISLFCHLNP